MDIYVNNSQTVKLLGGNIKSVTCKVKDEGVVKVKVVKTKAIKVVGLTEGKTKVVVTVTGKDNKSTKLTYKVTVKEEEIVKDSDSSTNESDIVTDDLDYVEELYVYDIDKVIETFDKAETIGKKFEKPVTVVFKSKDKGILEVPDNDYSHVIFRFKAPDVDVYNNAHFYRVLIENYED